MMDAKELRIGNKLQKSNGEIFAVSRLEDSLDILVEEKPGLLTLDYNLFGIPITEEILIKAGFTHSKTADKYFIKGSLAVSMADGKIRLIKGNFVCQIVLMELEFVHQLQNICYDLNEELQINL